MKESILKILRQTSTTDSQKLKLILELLNVKDNLYWENKLIKLSLHEIDKLNKTYWTHIINNLIQDLDSYIYKTGKIYKSHYLTIMNWARKAWLKKVQKIYICSYWNTHYVWTSCECWQF